VKTFCIECRHHCGAEADLPWHLHVCLHPDVQRVQERDPVTGRFGFVSRNSLGELYFTPDVSPCCRDFNRGNCEMYEPK
jgi:hypothetical protein